MTSINSLPSSYYSLSNFQPGASTTASSSSTPSLADALAAADASTGNDSSDAYSLNLSPAAQQLLGTTGASGTSGSSTTQSFVLTPQQQSAITAILQKYKDAPVNQTTFDAIQNALEAAGLGADQLSAQDQITSFDPTATLVSALNGNYTDPTTQSVQNSTTEQAKSSNYIQGIISQWQTLSGTAASASSSS